MNKTELRNSIISMTRSTGQGIPTHFIEYVHKDGLKWVDELVEDGKLIKYQCTGRNKLGNETWVLASNCYNVWEDQDTNHMALYYVRLFLGEKDLGLGLNPSTILNDPIECGKYNTWLEKNLSALNRMIALKEVKIKKVKKEK